MKIGILTFQDLHGRLRGSIGSSIIRGEWLANQWPEAELWTNGMKCDAMIYQKAYWKYHMHDFQGIKILDLCDPDWMRGECDLVELSQEIDAITCSTEALTETIKKMVKIPVITVSDRLDFNQFPTEVKVHQGQAKTVCWFGYMHNAEVVLNGIMPSLSRFNLRLHVISNKDFVPYNYFGIEVVNTHYDISTAYQLIREADVILNPYLMERNFKYKSNNKTLISWALGNPVAGTLEELELFMEASNRNKEMELRRKELKEKWDIKLSVIQYQELIKELCQKKNIKLS